MLCENNLIIVKTLMAIQLNLVVPKLVLRVYIGQLDLDIKTSRSNFAVLLLFLKSHSLYQYNLLTDMVVYDIPGKKKRFTINYLLCSSRFNSRINIQTQTDEIFTLYSVSKMFKNANWMEREVWDLFGIFFFGNRDLRRILTDYGFVGHPLRKDFPLTGFTEIYYSDSDRRILHCPVELMQEYRNFVFTSPWVL